MGPPDKAEKDAAMSFKLVKTVGLDGMAVGPRLGRLSLPHRRSMDTPNHFALTSRGAVPHMTPDVLGRHSKLGGVYIALEDFIEESSKHLAPAIFDTPQAGGKRLHTYTATPSSVVTVLGARRHPAVLSPLGNGRKAISVSTSTGFRRLGVDEYIRAITTLKPDVAIPLADLTSGCPSGARRQIRMVERTAEWLDILLQDPEVQDGLDSLDIRVFAPVLPVPHSVQREYLKHLSEDLFKRLSGLAIYDVDILADLGQTPSLVPLPRLSLHLTASPHHVLRQIRMGVDVFTPNFVNSISDSGVALACSFPPPAARSDGVVPLGVDMLTRSHNISLQPLVEGCSCYACSNHHRAYLHHLLNAKEMLAWTLLQIHNYHVMSQFFEGVRKSIADGSFDDQAALFARVYDAELPPGTGTRPRSRGYHFKPEAEQAKINAHS